MLTTIKCIVFFSFIIVSQIFIYAKDNTNELLVQYFNYKSNQNFIGFSCNDNRGKHIFFFNFLLKYNLKK